MEKLHDKEKLWTWWPHCRILNPLPTLPGGKKKKKKHPKNPEENTLKLTLGQNSPYTDAKGRQISSKKTNCNISYEYWRKHLRQNTSRSNSFPFARILTPPSLSFKLYFSELHLLGSRPWRRGQLLTQTAPGRSRSHASRPGHALRPSRPGSSPLTWETGGPGPPLSAGHGPERGGCRSIWQPNPESMKRGLHNQALPAPRQLPQLSPQASRRASRSTTRASTRAPYPELEAQVALMEWMRRRLAMSRRICKVFESGLASSAIVALASASAIAANTPASEEQIQRSVLRGVQTCRSLRAPLPPRALQSRGFWIFVFHILHIIRDTLRLVLCICACPVNSKRASSAPAPESTLRGSWASLPLTHPTSLGHHRALWDIINVRCVYTSINHIKWLGFIVRNKYWQFHIDQPVSKFGNNLL